MILNDSQIQKASRLWKAGFRAKEIANKLGRDITTANVYDHARRNREQFPIRTRTGSPYQVMNVTGLKGWDGKTTRRKTIGGAIITLPRISFIDGPHEETP